MSQSRSTRRAAERRAKKLARKQERLASTAGCPATDPQPNTLDLDLPELVDSTDPEPTVAPPPPVSAKPAPSPARLQANRANAQLSTGPTTEEGRKTSSKNALKTALTGRTVLLPGDDAERYVQHLEHYRRAHRPVGDRETAAVQLLADTWWRLERIPGIIEALYAKGCHELADKVSYLDQEARHAMLLAETYLAYERQFRNLEIQERRLFRQAEKLQTEIAALQAERAECEEQQLAAASLRYLAAKKNLQPFDPAGLGFEFSIAEIEAYLHAKGAHPCAEEVFLNTETRSQPASKAA